MTQPNAPQPTTAPAEEPILVFAGPAPLPDGTIIVQIRIVFGLCAFILEVTPERAARFGENVRTITAQAADMARRANLGLIVPGQANGHMPQLPGQPQA
jgi:hypothetical protein